MISTMDDAQVAQSHGGAAGDRPKRSSLPLYAAYYGLAESPFDLTPNPRFLFLSSRQREALSNLRYALASSKGFTVILGEAGTGKTTLVRTALATISASSRYVLVNNPTLGHQEFYEYLAREFRLSPAAATSKTRFLEELRTDIETRYITGGLSGLIVDEAQSLPHALLEEIRLLGNIETTTTKLLSVVLCGQPELADRLNDPSLRQLKQRIALRCELAPLSLSETASYVSGRLRIAGGSPGEIFTREAVIAIYEVSQGIPRTINVVCDNALIGGLAAQVKPVSAEIVESVRRDFDLRAAGEAERSGEPGAERDSSAASAPQALEKVSEQNLPMIGAGPVPPKRKSIFFS